MKTKKIILLEIGFFFLLNQLQVKLFFIFQFKKAKELVIQCAISWGWFSWINE